MTQHDFDNAKKHTSLPVTDEFIADPHGRLVPVLDLHAINTDSAVLGRKKAPTLVLRVPDEGIDAIV